jgi:hypothetical protein
MSATQSINTPARPGSKFNIPIAAATSLWAGILAAVNAAGNLVQAADAAGLKVVGRCEQDADNIGGAAGDLTADVLRGVFKLVNSATHALTVADLFKPCYIEDEQTVSSSPGTNGIIAGVLVAIDADGGVWVDTTLAAALYRTPVAITLGNTNGEIAALTFTAGGATGPEVEALRNKCEELADDLRAIKAALDAQGITS